MANVFYMTKFKKALGKKRCAKVSEFFDDGYNVDITLAENGHGDTWNYYYGGGTPDFTFSEIVFHAKRLIDEGGRIDDIY